MKNLFLRAGILLLLGSITVISCIKEDSTRIKFNNEDLNETIIETLINDYTQKLTYSFGNNIPPIMKPFSAIGSIESDLLKGENGQIAQGFLFTSETEIEEKSKWLKFQFDIKEPIDFPKEIKKARIIFIGNQLIIQDIKNNFLVNLFVKTGEDVENSTPQLTTIRGYGLGIQTVHHPTAAYIEWCDCYCDVCEDPGEPCPSRSCSCTCTHEGSTESCSKQCDSSANAECDKNCPSS